MKPFESAFLICIIPLFLSGCLADCGQMTDASWDQPGVFAEFPEEGRVGGFDVSYWRTPQGHVSAKYAQSLNNTEFSLLVEDDDHISWDWNSRTEHSKAETRDALERMFDALGLPDPQTGEQEFVWRGNEC